MLVEADVMPHHCSGIQNIGQLTCYGFAPLQEIDFKDSPNLSEGWVFHMLDAVTSLGSAATNTACLQDPGATILVSVLVHDVRKVARAYVRKRSEGIFRMIGRLLGVSRRISLSFFED